MESVQEIFVRALEHQKYYEATHLYLARWQKLHRLRTKDEKIYKALLHGAAALDFLTKRREKKAQEAWKIYLKYRRYLSENSSSDVEHYETLKKADTILMRLKQKYKELMRIEKV